MKNEKKGESGESVAVVVKESICICATNSDTLHI